jgi:5-methylcytosine-specific restriction endonuclease McrA
MNQKICSSCGKCFPLDQFSKDKRKPDGRCTKCKECFHAYYEANATKIKERVQEYRAVNIVIISEAAKRRYRANPDPIRERSAANHKANRPKRLERMRRYAANHAPEFFERNKAWRQKNLAYSRDYKKKRLENDPEKRKRQNMSNKEWAHRNPAVTRLGTLTRALRERLAACGHYTLTQWNQLLEACNYQCLACQVAAKDTPEGQLERDHVIALSTIPTDPDIPLTRQQTELDLISNIQPLCRKCNRKKGRKTIEYRSVKLRRQLAELFGSSGFALD